MFLDGKELKVLCTEEQLQTRIKEIGEELNKRFGEEEVYVICVLKGSIMFTVDLVKHLKMPIRMEFIRLASYGHDFTSSGKVKAIDISLPDINNKNVVIIEDIVDTGHTLTYLIKNLSTRQPASLKICTLLNKECRREVKLTPDYVGFEIDNYFVLGYGLDYAEKYRNLPEIGVLKPEIYTK